jgi:hypothetical protein
MIQPTDRLARVTSGKLELCLLVLGAGSALAVWRSIAFLARHEFFAS